jgi:hypothetical protein
MNFNLTWLVMEDIVGGVGGVEKKLSRSRIE